MACDELLDKASHTLKKKTSNKPRPPPRRLQWLSQKTSREAKK